jgi:dTMP kinase
MSLGRFIVLEGLDGAGTTTQAHRYQRYCTQRHFDSFLTYEPTGDPIGAFIRTLLAGDPGTTPSQHVLGLLFAADRLAHSEVIERHRAEGRDVVCDRYIFSSLAYQTLDPAIEPQWVADINAGCSMPDVTFFLDVPVDVCLERISARGDDRTIYERKDRLDTIRDNYARLETFYRERYGTLVTIDGTLPPDDVHAAILDTLND